MRINPLFVCVCVTFFVGGCSMEGGAAPGAADLKAEASMVDQTPAAPLPLAESLFKEDQAVISNQAMAEILSAKITLPKDGKLAVVRFGQMPYWWGWSEDFVRVNRQIDDDFLGRLKTAPRVRDVAYLPSLV